MLIVRRVADWLRGCGIRLGLSAVAVAGAGCGGTEGGVAAFIDAVGADSDADYDPMMSAADGVEVADLIVVGRIVGVTEGRQVDESANSGPIVARFAIFQVEVEKVVHGTRLDGDSGLLNVNIYVDLLTPWDSIAGSVPDARALFVMSDLLDWNPRGRLEGFPAVTYFANPDGLWFETEGGPPAGVYAEIADVERRWGEAIPTLDDFIAKLEVAAAAE